MMLVAAVEDFDDAHEADMCVMTTQTVPRSQTGLSEGFVPAASERLNLLGGRNKNAPANAPPGAAGTEHRLTCSPVLAWSQRRSAQAACDQPQREAAVFLGQPVGFLTTESVAEGNALRVSVHERKLADFLPGQSKVPADATCSWHVNEALAQLASPVP
jgi:hypothetical protein